MPSVYSYPFSSSSTFRNDALSTQVTTIVGRLLERETLLCANTIDKHQSMIFLCEYDCIS